MTIIECKKCGRACDMCELDTTTDEDGNDSVNDLSIETESNIEYDTTVEASIKSPSDDEMSSDDSVNTENSYINSYLTTCIYCNLDCKSEFLTSRENLIRTLKHERECSSNTRQIVVEPLSDTTRVITCENGSLTVSFARYNHK